MQIRADNITFSVYAPHCCDVIIANPGVYEICISVSKTSKICCGVKVSLIEKNYIIKGERKGQMGIED